MHWPTVSDCGKRADVDLEAAVAVAVVARHVQVDDAEDVAVRMVGDVRLAAEQALLLAGEPDDA